MTLKRSSSSTAPYFPSSSFSPQRVKSSRFFNSTPCELAATAAEAPLLCFHHVANPFFRNSFESMLLQTARGGVPYQRRALLAKARREQAKPNSIRHIRFCRGFALYRLHRTIEDGSHEKSKSASERSGNRNARRSARAGRSDSVDAFE